MKDKGVENAHLKFHNSMVILQFWVELAIYGGHLKKSSVCIKNNNGCTCLLLELFGDFSFLSWATIALDGQLFSLNPN